MIDMLALDDGLDLQTFQFGVALDFHEPNEEARAKSFKENTTKQKILEAGEDSRKQFGLQKKQTKKRKKKQIKCSRCSKSRRQLLFIPNPCRWCIAIALRQKNALKT